MSEGLKPCPFCGGEARFEPLYDNSVNVWCYAECGAELYHRTESGAIAAWNTRAADTRIVSLEEENARLRKVLDFYAKDHPWPNDGPWGADSSDFGKVARAALSIRGEG